MNFYEKKTTKKSNLADRLNICWVLFLCSLITNTLFRRLLSILFYQESRKILSSYRDKLR